MAKNTDEVVELIKGYKISIAPKYIEEARKILTPVEKGFRKPNKKDVQRATEILTEDRRERAVYFQDIYEALKEATGIQIGLLGFKQVQEGIYSEEIGFKAYTKPVVPETKVWSKAMADNLDLRRACEHQLNPEGTVCEKCGLNPENWGKAGVGVTGDYGTKMLEKVVAEQEKEKAAEKEND